MLQKIIDYWDKSDSDNRWGPFLILNMLSFISVFTFICFSLKLIASYMVICLIGYLAGFIFLFLLTSRYDIENRVLVILFCAAWLTTLLSVISFFILRAVFSIPTHLANLHEKLSTMKLPKISLPKKLSKKPVVPVLGPYRNNNCCPTCERPL